MSLEILLSLVHDAVYTPAMMRDVEMYYLFASSI